MPTDIYVNDLFDTEWNGVGDLATVEGNEYVYQTIVVALQENLDEQVPSLTPTSVEQHRSRIERIIENHHATSDPISVSIETMDVQSRMLTYSIETNEASFPLTVSE
jgi:hypothetical protein